MTDIIIKSIEKKIIKYSDDLAMKVFPLPGKSVLVGGCFDVFHFGHWKLLSEAKKQGNILIVALESDEFIKRIKQRNSIHNQKQRALILASFVMVDWVICLPDFQDEQEYFDLVSRIKPSIIAVTKGDFKMTKKEKQASIINAKVVVVTKSINGMSSYNIINSVKNK